MNKDISNPWVCFIALLFATFVTVEAAAFQAPVLPSVTAHFDIAVNLAALILISYFIAVAVFAPMMGRLGDRYGRRRMVSIGLVVFGVAEFMAAWAPSFWVFLLARFLQGLGVACIFPAVFSYVNRLFREDQRGMALGPTFPDNNYVYTVANDNLEPTLHVDYKKLSWLKSRLLVNSLKIYSRNLTDVELIQNYKVEKERFGM